jgi:cardiolipin synthase
VVGPGERGADRATSGRVFTVANMVSFARLLGVPLFLWLFLGAHQDGWAVTVLVLGGLSDWVDGYLARRLNQVSQLGVIMDPLADRLYILATLIAFTVREVVPLWFAAALILRELILGVGLLVLRRYGGYSALPVHYLGKVATFILLCAFPTLLVAHLDPAVGWYALGWALAWWGLVLYWVAGVIYVIQVIWAVRAVRTASA